MPTYVYEVCQCSTPEKEEIERLYPNAQSFDTFELNVPIAQRDTARCADCNSLLKRRIAFNGLTWAPTAGGMR